MYINIIVGLALLFATAYAADSPIVTVEQGALQGAELNLVTKDGTYFSFKGIPYAAPPVGANRFKAPLPPVAWSGTRNATAHGNKCPQFDFFSQKILSDEDCLFLNVYTQNLTPKTPLPVIFYIHGGGNRFGSGNTEEFGPDFLVTRNVVVVTINYRLEFLGFLSLDTADVPGNAAFKDQVAALKWVKANIKNFGGDPNNVTIMGQSTGGAAVIFHAISTLSKGLFKRAISMSGTPLNDWAVPFKVKRRAFNFGKKLGFYTTNTTDLLNFLQSQPAEKLVNVPSIILSIEQTGDNRIKQFPFTAVVETQSGANAFLAENAKAAILKGRIKGVDLMMGITSKETLYAIPELLRIAPKYEELPELLVPKYLLETLEPQKFLQRADLIREFYFGDEAISNSTLKQFVDYSSDIMFAYAGQKFATILPAIPNHSRYFYQFSAISTRNVYGSGGAKYNITGASHLDDLMYLFNSERINLAIDKTSEAYKIIDNICNLFTNFAKTGNPTPDNSLGVTWPQFDATGKKYLDIGNTLAVSTGLNVKTQAFWDFVYTNDLL